MNPAVERIARRDRLRRVHLPAPIGGINTISAGVDMPSTDLVYCYNMIGAEYGLRSRLGWREWCTGLGGEQVRSLLPFTGSTASGGNDRLFACTTSGIWDVSSSSAAPSKVVTFGTANTDSGFGISCVFVAAGGHYLCYTDEANGYYTYAETGAAWTAGGIGGTPVTGADPTKLVFVMPWKNRLWFVEKDSGKGWYLGIGAVSGAATSFTFGNRFKAGGDLRGLYSWTYDGGSGIDDRLVAVSGGGDVLVYVGTDPSSASTFSLDGVWQVGAVPAYRRLATDFGGDLLLMSTTGLLPLSKLVIGNVVYDRSQYQTYKIANTFNQLQQGTRTMRGWGMYLHPEDAALILTVPTAAAQPTQQLAMSISTRGWHQYRDMPMGVCAATWGGKLYFGTEDGRVCINDGYVDGILLSNVNAYSTINWSFLTAPTNLGSPNQKRVSQIVTSIISQGGSTTHTAAPRFGWDMAEPAAPSGTTTVAGGWDSGLWDTALWGGGYSPQRTVFGAIGLGSVAAIAVRGSSSSRTVVTGIDVAFEEGGLL